MNGTISAKACRETAPIVIWFNFSSRNVGLLSRRAGSLSALCLALLPAGAGAASLFDVTVDAGGTSASRGFSNFNGFSDAFADTASLNAINPNYTSTSPAFIDGNLRGVTIQVIYPTSGPELVFAVPALNESIPFDSQATRAENEDDLQTYLENDTNEIVTRILNLLVQTTATDPVAGNPNSLQSQMIEADFGFGSNVGPLNGMSTFATNGNTQNLLGLAARLGRYQAQGNDVTVIDLPLSYTIPLADPRYRIILSAPIGYSDTEGYQSYAGSLGVGFRLPVLDFWDLTPAVRVGATGSDDLGALAVLSSASLTSNLNFEFNGLELDIGNLLAYIQTSNSSISVGDYDASYDLQNAITRNGVSLRGRLDREFLTLPANWAVSVINTQIFGDAVYIENYTDIAFSVGTESSANGLTWDSIRLGLTYTFADKDFEGFRVNFGYQF